jgi:dihydrofolate reductase
MLSNRKLVFYGATSLDGYIARNNDSLDWLFKTEGDGEDNGYSDFYRTVDTILIGRKTYDQILIHAPQVFPYKGKQCYVFSRSLSGSNDFVEYVHDDIVGFTKSLKAQGGTNIWIVGGGEVLYPLVQGKLVDEFIIQVAPTIIGQGIPLFIPGTFELELSLVDVRRYNQFAELHYKVK